MTARREGDLNSTFKVYINPQDLRAVSICLGKIGILDLMEKHEQRKRPKPKKYIVKKLVQETKCSGDLKVPCSCGFLLHFRHKARSPISVSLENSCISPDADFPGFEH